MARRVAYRPTVLPCLCHTAAGTLHRLAGYTVYVDFLPLSRCILVQRRRLC